MPQGKRTRGWLRLVVCALALAAAAAPGQGASAKSKTTSRATRQVDRRPATVISPADLHQAIAEQRGHVVLLHLWATWCFPCLEELPLIGRFAVEMKAKGVEVVSVSLDEPVNAARARVSRVLTQKGADALTSFIVRVEDPGAFVSGLDPSWDGDIPALFVYDKQGRMRRGHVGLAERADLDALVAEAQQERPSGPAAATR